MANLIAMNILNRKYVNNPKELLTDAKLYLGFENKEYDDDIEWSEDACCLFHNETIEFSNIRVGTLSEIFTSTERCEYGLVELDMSNLGFICIEAGNSKYITVSESDNVESVFYYIIANDDKIIDIMTDYNLIWVPVQITKDMIHKDNKELLQRIYEYSLVGLE